MFSFLAAQGAVRTVFLMIHFLNGSWNLTLAPHEALLASLDKLGGDYADLNFVN